MTDVASGTSKTRGQNRRVWNIIYISAHIRTGNSLCHRFLGAG